MKSLISFVMFFGTIGSYAQSPNVKDSIKVIYADDTASKLQPAVFVNGFFFNRVSGLNPDDIESVNIAKENYTSPEGTKYFGKVFVKSKSEIKPISLRTLKDRFIHMGIKKQPIIFQVDNDIINTKDYSSYMIDENRVSEIIVSDIASDNKHIDFKLIKILTKSEEKSKSKSIMIRGSETARK